MQAHETPQGRAGMVGAMVLGRGTARRFGRHSAARQAQRVQRRARSPNSMLSGGLIVCTVASGQTRRVRWRKQSGAWN